MKHYLLYILIGLVTLPACGQGVTDYYQLPEKNGPASRLLNRYGGPQIRDRWYVSLEGFARTDRAKLDNSFDGLITSDVVTRAGWGVLLGWSYRERWAVEGGYSRTPIHTQLSISHTNPVVSARSTNDRHAFVLRGKSLLFSTSKPWLRSGFWVSGGMWAMPNSSQEVDRFSLNTGSRYPGRWEAPESFQLTSQTQTSSQLTTLAEVGVEYNVRLSSALDLGITARKLWGLGNAITTDVTYTANRMASQQAQLRGTGSGMSFGVSLRYSYAIRRHRTNVLNVQGKSRLGD